MKIRCFVGITCFFWIIFLNICFAEIVTVVQVIDGDTIKVNFDGKIEKIRIIGIDAPETKNPKKAPEYFGKESTLYAEKLLKPGAKVMLVFDDKNNQIGHRDRYGRLLANVLYDGGKNFGEAMIRNGYAKLYSKYDFEKMLAVQYFNAEEYARKNKLGLWKKPTKSNNLTKGEVIQIVKNTRIKFEDGYVSRDTVIGNIRACEKGQIVQLKSLSWNAVPQKGGTWNVIFKYIALKERSTAIWNYDPKNKKVKCMNSSARELSLF